jgi:endonuclease/exonuclease/phosphatase family metal-dependent hydrolase
MHMDQRRLTRATRCSLAIALTVFALAAPPDGASAQAGDTLRALHWNIAGAVTDWPWGDSNKPANSGTLQVAWRLADEVLRRDAQLVSINEACSQQVGLVLTRLRAAGKTAYHQFSPSYSRFSNPLCGNGLAGNAVIAIDASETHGRTTIFLDNEGVTGDSGTERNAACVDVSFGAHRVFACSTHLESGNDPAAVAQARSLSSTLLARYPGQPIVLVGDFNVRPSALPFVYSPEQGGEGGFHEADYNPALPERARGTYSWSASAESRRKLDYVFADRGHFANAPMSDIVDGGRCITPVGRRPCSDHLMVASTLQFLTDPQTPPPEPPPAERAVECFVFADGGESRSAPADALYFAGPEQVCIPEPAGILDDRADDDEPAPVFCGKWFSCQTVQGKLPVTFQVFSDGGANAVSATAVYVRDVEQACISDGTPTGACRKWFGEASLTDGRRVACRLFADGYGAMTNPTRAIYYREPSVICTPDGTPQGTCRKWFGRCAIEP